MDFKDPASRAPAGTDERWGQELLARVAFASLMEQRRARRWGIFFKSLFFLYLLSMTLLVLRPGLWEQGLAEVSDGHTALVSVEGIIASGADASAENVIRGLRAAFEDSATRGVVLAINSPGGSPVESGLIYREIRRLREQHPQIPLYAVAADVCASGGYYVAAAADRIYADPASLVGSIGVRAGGFGFTEAMDKLGIERRVYAAGENKALLDPFAPEQPEEVRHMEQLLDSVHQQFIAAVREGRGDRLEDRPDLFSGLIWTGEQGLDLGLVDELGSVYSVSEEQIGASRIVDYTRRNRLFEELFQTSAGASTNWLWGLLGWLAR